MTYKTTAIVGLASIAALFLLSGCPSVNGDDTQSDSQETESITVAVENNSAVEVYYVAFLADGLDPETEPPDSWVVYSLGDDYVLPGKAGDFALEKPHGACCSIFVGRNTFELSPIDKGWRWDQPYNGENLRFTLQQEDAEPPSYSTMSMNGGPDFLRDYINLDPG